MKPWNESSVHTSLVGLAVSISEVHRELRRMSSPDLIDPETFSKFAALTAAFQDLDHAAHRSFLMMQGIHTPARPNLATDTPHGVEEPKLVVRRRRVGRFDQ